MRFAYNSRMESTLETAIHDWHTSLTDGDPRRAVTDPVVVLGPKGAGPITPAQFADWVRRSGIRLVPRSRHPIGDRFMVVEQDASWPDDPGPTRLATVFRVTDGRVSAALRLPTLREALDLAYICRELAATA